MKNLMFCCMAVLCPLFLLAQEAVLSSEKKQQLLQNLTQLISTSYVYPDKAKEIVRYLEQQKAAAVYDTLHNAVELANQLSKDIGYSSNDKHLRVDYNPKLEKDILLFMASGKQAEKITQADQIEEQKKNFHFKKIQILPSNIGYVEFTNFASPGKEARKTFDAAMQFVSHTDALIIDLRNNFGGNGTMAAEMLAYFFDRRTYTGRAFNRIDNKWTDSYMAGNKSNRLVYDKPVYILTSHGTFSAAEGFAYALKHLRKSTIIGETTRGGAHLTRSFSLGNGFVGFIPYARFENAITKTDWEGTGVLPDISVAAEQGLLRAQQEILSQKWLAADEKEKKKISWLLNYYQSKTSNTTISPNIAEKYQGRYAEFEVVFENNELKIRDTNQPTPQFKILKPISETFFQAGEDYQVEFLGTENTKALTMYWDDGWAEKIQKQE